MVGKYQTWARSLKSRSEAKALILQNPRSRSEAEALAGLESRSRSEAFKDFSEGKTKGTVRVAQQAFLTHA